MRKLLENVAASRQSLVPMLKGLESGTLSSGSRAALDLRSYITGGIDTHKYTKVKTKKWILISLMGISACLFSCLSSLFPSKIIIKKNPQKKETQKRFSVRHFGD